MNIELALKQSKSMATADLTCRKLLLSLAPSPRMLNFLSHLWTAPSDGDATTPSTITLYVVYRGKPHEIRLHQSSPLSQLTHLLASLTNQREDTITLSFGGCNQLLIHIVMLGELKDGKATLASYGVCEGSRLQMLVRLH